MSKHVGRGSASLSQRFSMDTFLTHVLRDLSAYTDLSGAAAIFACKPEDFRKAVDHEVATEESRLLDGSFTRYTVVRQLQAFVKKHETWRPLESAEKTRRSMAKFLYAERKCSRTNKRLRWYTDHWSRQGTCHAVLNEAKQIIHNIIGDLDARTYREILDASGFGAGQTASGTNGEHAGLLHKLTGPFSITPNARPILFDYMRRNDNWLNKLSPESVMDETIKVQNWGRLAIVPKNWDIGRPIEIQPSFNIFFQKGVDCILKRKLQKTGVYLRDQDYNREVAFRASCDGKSSTVDLSSASDTIAFELVRCLLPPSWFWLLDALRTTHYSQDRGQTEHRLEKFSAMGNGYTFPLESLIFYSIAKACCIRTNAPQEDLRVYGDDIIIDTSATLLFFEVASYAGFDINEEKSFVFGPFRETCGVDVINGVDIRPVYLKSDPRDPGEVYNLYNRLLTNRVGLAYPNCLKYLLSLVNKPHFGPWTQGMGDSLKFSYEGNIVYDSYFISEPPEDRVWNSDYQCYEYHVKFLSRKAKSQDVRDISVRYLAFLLGNKCGEILSATRYTYRDKKARVVNWPTIKEVKRNVCCSRTLKVYTLGAEGSWILRGDRREWMGALF